MNAFRKWLKAQLANLHANMDEYADSDFDDAGSIVAEASRRAATLGFGQWSKYAATERLAPQRAREILAEMIGATDTKPDTLTVPQAAKQLKVSPAKVYAYIREGKLAASNVNKPGVRPSYRISADALRELETRAIPPISLPVVPQHYAT